jgi:hypothetical protein
MVKEEGEMFQPDVLVSISSIVAGFATAVLLLRIQREVQMAEKGKRSWIPGSDWLLIATIFASLFLVLLPVVAIKFSTDIGNRIPTAVCAGTLVVMGLYPFSILAHYRLIFGRNRSGERERTEPAEKLIVGIIATIALVVGILVLANGQITIHIV